MKYKRIVASTKPVTTIVVAGQPRHYFHSEVLGQCRAILISRDENLPSAPPPFKDPWDSFLNALDDEDKP